MSANSVPESESRRWLAAAKEIALEAGALIKQLQRSAPQIRHKGEIDIVTSADLEAERLIVSELNRRFPNMDVLAEEGGGNVDSELMWVIDPIDGTTNYAHGFPIFTVSIAAMVGRRSEVGVVYEPNLREMFYAVRGQGAFLNDRPINVSEISTLDQALLATGFPYSLRSTHRTVLAEFERVLLACQGVRRAGAATIDLCYLASGRVDAFWERELKPWDTAAAALIASEAGAVITKYDGSEFDHFTPELAASNGLLHQELLGLLVG